MNITCDEKEVRFSNSIGIRRHLRIIEKKGSAGIWYQDLPYKGSVFNCKHEEGGIKQYERDREANANLTMEGQYRVFDEIVIQLDEQRQS